MDDDIFSGTGTQKQTTNAIFNIDNYADVYRNDLLTAEKEIIISSPAISDKKVYEMIHLLREKQEGGIILVNEMNCQIYAACFIS